MRHFPDILICPVCRSSLFPQGGTLCCERGHSYDISRFGYVNLLPPGKGRNARSGDERAMLRARAAFLRKGFYDPMDKAAVRLLAENLPKERCETFLVDMGAGEGTHTCRVAVLLGEERAGDVYALGFDASKHGAEFGCRYARSLGIFPDEAMTGGDSLHENPSGKIVRAADFPGNIFHLPVKDGAADAALSLFAPIAWEEARRVLTEGGLFLVISAGKKHLYEMRRILYDEVRLTDFAPVLPESAGFSLIERETLSFPVSLESGEDVQNLFKMTPFYHKTPEAGRERLSHTEKLTVTAEMTLSLYRADQQPVTEEA